jgi:nucleoside-diphosphate-sugar epimerase
MSSSDHAASSSRSSRSRLLVFGCGYIGGAVADAALARGWRVTALTRNEEHADKLRARSIDVVVGDLANDAWHAAVSTEQDHVINCVSSGGGGLAGYRHSYVEGTRSILAWARRGCAATFLYTGSTSVYPQANGELVTEQSPTGTGGSEASAPLLETEQLVRESRCFARWFVLRLAGIYGPGRHFLLDQLRGGATLFPGTGAHRLNLAHRDDIVAAIFACLDARAATRDAIFNVADDQPATKAEVAAWLAARVGVAAPQFAHDAGAMAQTDTTLVRGRSGPVPDRAISNARLKTTLGWRPAFPNFREGYEQIFETEKL